MDSQPGVPARKELSEEDLQGIEDSDLLKQELDNMLGSLSLELAELVSGASPPEPSSDADVNSGDAPKRRVANQAFLRPSPSAHLVQPAAEDDNMSGSDDEEMLTAEATEELKSMLKSVSATSLPLSDGGSVSAEKTVIAEGTAGLSVEDANFPIEDGVVTCTMAEFLGEDNGFQESDDESDPKDSADAAEAEPTGSSGGYWSSVGSYAAAGWGLATASIAKATELSKTSLAVTKQTLAGKVSILKSDPDLAARREQEYIELLRQPKAIEIIVTSGQSARVPFNIPKGYSLSWKVRVKEYDVGFGVRERKQAKGGAVDEHLEEMRKVRSTDSTISGGLEACEWSRQVVLVFDNSYSKLRPKACLYCVHCGKDAFVVPLLETVTKANSTSNLDTIGHSKESEQSIKLETEGLAWVQENQLAAEQAEADELAVEKSEAEQLAAEQAEADELAVETAEAEQLAAEQAKADRIAAETAEADRLAAEQAEADRLAAEQAEADRLAAEQAEADRLAAEKAEADRLAAEQAEADRLAAEQAEADRLAAEQAEADRRAAEKAEADRLAVEQAEADRLAAEQAEADRLAAEQAEADRLAAEQAEAEDAASVVSPSSKGRGSVTLTARSVEEEMSLMCSASPAKIVPFDNAALGSGGLAPELVAMSELLHSDDCADQLKGVKLFARWNNTATIGDESSTIVLALLSGLMVCMQSGNTEVQQHAVYCLQQILARGLALSSAGVAHVTDVIVNSLFSSKLPDTIMEAMKTARALVQSYPTDVLPVLLIGTDNKDLACGLQSVECISKCLGEELNLRTIPNDLLVSMVNQLMQCVATGKPKMRTAALKPLKVALLMFPNEVRPVMEAAAEELKVEPVRKLLNPPFR